MRGGVFVSTATVQARVRLRVLTNSEQRTFRRCAREHHLAYGMGYRSVSKPEALRFGDLVHVGLEAWWLADDHARLDAAIEAMGPRAFDEFELVRAGVLMQGYDARWHDEPLAMIAVEREFRAPLLNPETGAASRTYELAGKLDVIVRDLRDGLVKIVEHKTTSEDIGAGSQYWQKLQLDPQISTYYAGAKSLGYDVGGCLYDVLYKPGLRPGQVPVTDELGAKIVLDAQGNRVRTKKGSWRQTASTEDGYVLQTRPETPDEFRQRLLDAIASDPDRYYQRGTVVRLAAEERDAAFDTWQTARLIHEAKLAKRWPRNPDACQRFGRLCSYFGVCTGTESLNDTTLFTRVTNVHQELSEVA